MMMTIMMVARTYDNRQNMPQTIVMVMMKVIIKDNGDDSDDSDK